MRAGNLVNMVSFTHHQPTLKVGFSAPKGRVAVFLLLGDADKKDPDSFDAVRALSSLGWVEGEPHQYDEAKELALCRAHWESVGTGTPFPDLWEGWKACAKARSHE